MNLLKNILVLPFLLFAIFVLSSLKPEHKQQKFKLKKVVLDAGHGGKDPGCVGKTYKEAEIALKVVLELGKLIKEQHPDVEVIYTRKENKFVELGERANIANKSNADLFISIHCNASPNTGVRGTETYFMGMHKTDDNLDVAKRENAVVMQEENYLDKYDGFDPSSPISHILFANYQNAFLSNSLHFAEKVEKRMSEKTGLKSRGVRQAGFLVLWKTTMPSTLVEIGYLSNLEEEKFLGKAENQLKIAEGIANAFTDYKESLEKRMED
ncbi:MAG: N-acetylmuramoyl-L-alanine amidase [Cytophagales bacterium]